MYFWLIEKNGGLRSCCGSDTHHGILSCVTISHSGYLAFMLLSYCVCTEKGQLTSWFTSIKQTQTSCELLFPFGLLWVFIQRLMPSYRNMHRAPGSEKSWQTRCYTSESCLFDLSVALFSNKLTRNCGHFIGLGPFVQASLPGEFRHLWENVCAVLFGSFCRR